jgi:putative endonuclease
VRPPEADETAGMWYNKLMLYTVYVLKNSAGILYKGITEDLERRLLQHNAGYSRWTKDKGPWELVYTETFYDKTVALKREKFFKSGKGREFVYQILQCKSENGV